jgi:hypothetical protein
MKETPYCSLPSPTAEKKIVHDFAIWVPAAIVRVSVCLSVLTTYEMPVENPVQVTAIILCYYYHYHYH